MAKARKNRVATTASLSSPPRPAGSAPGSWSSRALPGWSRRGPPPRPGLRPQQQVQMQVRVRVPRMLMPAVPVRSQQDLANGGQARLLPLPPPPPLLPLPPLQLPRAGAILVIAAAPCRDLVLPWADPGPRMQGALAAAATAAVVARRDHSFPSIYASVPSPTMLQQLLLRTIMTVRLKSCLQPMPTRRSLPTVLVPARRTSPPPPPPSEPILLKTPTPPRSYGLIPVLI
mmetsp:Transcript_3833/g.8640  ORF Transcript_3833/g.8640 Transcript_3833/m.8640 type:complete len:230 (-) Transcript_3833:2630-3319(-)